ncbi:hypothetical protein P879_07915 [Paragonimus westermani]|uniref:S-methyl-5'-thioadenosine phosphorylase n=1 Tax=Paragonimus westermani TaxID=34504 RepID=A0A8T0DDE5_9TREM|nr:hypothetical protein P879_07915 [Paragonimus westermani]
MSRVKVGIIGGSGMNDPHIFKNPIERRMRTIFGEPSDALIEGTVNNVPCVVLARHGRDHSIIPSDINYRANIMALKEAGCTHILATNASGGLQDYTQPGDLVILDQFMDQTRGREQSLYGGRERHLDGVLHIPMAEPFCEETRKVLIEAARTCSLTVWDRQRDPTGPERHPCVHARGSSVTINGPRFSTRFESRLYRSWGLDLINMTVVPEVVLAREAGLSYASVSIVTDYDCWKTGAESVSVHAVLDNFAHSVQKVTSLLVKAIELIGRRDWTDLIRSNAQLVVDSRQDLAHRMKKCDTDNTS